MKSTESAPAVSVIIPSYNHEQFVEECIQSVLDQTFQDFEIIITDDASSDHTVQIIERFDDPRIKLFKHSKNKGASIAANNCIVHSKGKYIAMLSSDDAWHPEKLEIQATYLDQHPEIGAVFGKVDWVDETGQSIKDKNFPYMNVFDVRNRSRFEWLRHFFYKGNCLCHPCSLVRRECYKEIGLLNPAFANIPDFDLWVRLCLRYDIKILDRKLIRFRRMTNEKNASGDTNISRIRNRFEYRHTLNHYLKIRNPDEFLLVFPKAARYGKVTTDVIPFFLGRLAIENGQDFMALWGLDLIYDLLQDERTAEILQTNFSFTDRDFIDLSGKYDPFRISAVFPVMQLPEVSQQSLFRMLLSSSKKFVKEIYLIIVRSLGK
jgi:glycosyltransferase involved in cell wall biosynthesis